MSSSSSNGKHSAIRIRSLLLKLAIWEQVREVNVVIFWEKARNPFAGTVRWLERLSDVIFNDGKREILRRRASRSPWKRVRLRELRFVNLSKRRQRKGRVGLRIVSENRIRLMIERSCLETREREFK
jgi:hypothetical protein